jgi:glucose/mannose-6-phosphate isomerase
MLTSATDHPRVTIRQQITAEILGNVGVQVEWAAARGERPLAQMLSIIHFGDYVSYYLALLNGADPTRIDAINHLKEALSAS